MTTKTELRYLEAPIEIREAGDSGGLGVLMGIAARYDTLSQDLGGFREKIAPGAFARTLERDDEVMAFVDHDSRARIGRRSAGSLRLSDSAEGLRFEIDVPDTTTGRDLLAEVRAGLIGGMSFGFVAVRDEIDSGDEPVTRTLIEVDLLEISAVGEPAYPDTTIAQRSISAHAAKGGDVPAARARMRMRLRLAGGA